MPDIIMTITPDGVTADPNPQAARRGDPVTWVFPANATGLRVVFKKANFPSGSVMLSEQGPFYMPLSMSVTARGIELSGTIGGGVPDGRYLYDIHDQNNQSLRWLVPLSHDQNFGGLDVPKTPPF